MSLWYVCIHVIVFGLFVSLSMYPMVAVIVMRVLLLFVLHVCMLRECEGVRVTAMLV